MRSWYTVYRRQAGIHAPIVRMQTPSLTRDAEGVIAVKLQVQKLTAFEQVTSKLTDSVRAFDFAGGDAHGIRSLHEVDHQGVRGHRPAK